MTLTRDVQSEEAPFSVGIDWVAVSDVYIPLGEIELNGVRFAAIPRIKAAVNLSGSQRGIHASRSVEAVKWAALRVDGSTFHKLASLIAGKLLENHSYSTRAYSVVNAKFFNAEKTPVSMNDSLESFDIILKSYAKRFNGAVILRNFIGVKTTGITACPCAQQVIQEIYAKANGGGSTPGVTHMQRCYASVLVETDGSIAFEDLLEVLRKSFSSRTLELLKRHDEAALVLEAVESPRFVEDVVRHVAEKVVRRFPQIPDENHVIIRVKSLESIHQHNLESTLRTTFGKLRKNLN
ncbi:MAG: GTP cyclohydrolase, FolE2/MptA family [Candidatus Caldarchaeum sp.]|uniref:GTP cyclohydrolase I FolE2 n=1 Tax=Caldiarchaeum subterraneum TaxID=311458 RepID=A0A7C5Q7D6_CALS0